MKLVSFSVVNYRSIEKSPKLEIKDSLTVLLGPNNEGKSNFLNAIATALNILERLKYYSAKEFGSAKKNKRIVFSPRLVSERVYSWERDFPIYKQENEQEGATEFTLEFQLTEEENVSFRDKVQSGLTGILPVLITASQTGFTFRVKKKGAAILSNKVGEIARFISNNLVFQYIPTVRTAKGSRKIVEDVVEKEIEVLGNSQDYKNALKEISRIQQPILSTISKNITQELKNFLPQVKSVKIKINNETRFRFSRSIEIIIDDGSPTLLETKGDGIISLVTIGLIRQSTRISSQGKSLILAIEEPESHLHPQAMHQLNDVIKEISNDHQVIITTHNQAFVERNNIEANIIIQNQRPHVAQNTGEIRDSLGVRIGDNLVNCEVVLIVEGPEDEKVLKHFICAKSSKLKSAFGDNRININILHGAGGLSYKILKLTDFLNIDLCGDQ